jgi:hypothetical protein
MPASLVSDMLNIHMEYKKLEAEEIDKATKKVK